MNFAIHQIFIQKKTNNECVLKSRLDISLKLLFDEYKSKKWGVENDTQQIHDRYLVIRMIHMVGILFCKQ